MATYTTQLKTIVEQGYDLQLDEYPIWDEAARTPLNETILHHYWFREIGLETAALFRFHLKRVMAEIMPYYNQLFKTTQYQYDPTNSYALKEVLSEETTGENNVDTTTNDNTTGNGKNLFSDTPQTLLDDGSIANEKYLTTATLTSSETTGKQTIASMGDAKGTRDYTKNITGNAYHNVAELVSDYRKTLISIMDEIARNPRIDELFMRIW